MPANVALVVAAGRGRRAGDGLPKQYRPLNGMPVLRRTLLALQAASGIDDVFVVIHPDDLDLYLETTAGLDLPDPIFGGAERQDSVRLGLEALRERAPQTVLIHDAARPFVDSALIERILSGLETADAAIPGLEIVDSVKRATQDGMISSAVDRNGLYRVQTPQGFRYGDILRAHEQAKGLALTDDAAVAEGAGLRIAIVAGSEANIKLTTAEDYRKAEQSMQEQRWPRCGNGFDVHRFTDGDHVILCGVKIPHDRRLEGHSDADVALHAITDAILGAIAAGDIGTHFPPTDPQWKGASSDRFLAHAAKLVRDRGGEILNIDLTLICQAPKIGPHRPAMAEEVARILDLPQDRVSIKATTTEKLGFTGRGEGIAAQATAMVLA